MMEYGLRVYGFKGCTMGRFDHYVHKGNGRNVGYHPGSQEIYTDDSTLADEMVNDESLKSLGLVPARKVSNLNGWPYIVNR